MDSIILEIKEEIKNKLSTYRYQHSINVMEEAVKLARYYGVDEDKCKICALTHDMAKEFSEEENKRFIEKYELSEDILLKENKNLLHGYIAAIIVKEKYGFTDDMVKAVKYHSTGYVGMDMLAKIIYLADKIEKGKDYPGIEEEREYAYKNIDKAIVICLCNQIKRLVKDGKKVNLLAYTTLGSLIK